ncbi:hypothetical protein [Marinovum sp.]|uniref:hypothetical protein n=1 Tax=Marinovum sp. TaxID=2024839 RepID=UPI003A95C0E9
MVQTNKILTVSYGTFSCTLEGFDESFETMKAIAEYFRDLAADDRYFGAEPPTPDAEMLARIAEKEISRRVEARFEDDGIVLRPSLAAVAEAETAPEPVQQEPVQQAEPEAPEPEAEPQAEVAAQVEETPEAQPEPAPAVSDTVSDADLDEELETMAAALDLYDAEEAAAEEAEAPAEEAAEEEAPAAEIAAPAKVEVDDSAVEAAKPDRMPESIADKLARIRAVVSSAASKPKAEAPVVEEAEIEEETAEAPEVEAVETPDIAAGSDSDPVIGNIMSTLTSGDAEDTLIETPAMEEAPVEISLDGIEDLAPQKPEMLEEAVEATEETPVVEEEAAEEEQVEAAEASEEEAEAAEVQAEADDAPEAQAEAPGETAPVAPRRVAPRRPVRVIKVKRRAVDTPPSTLSQDDEAELMRELAEVEAELETPKVEAAEPAEPEETPISEETALEISDVVEDTQRAVRAMARRDRRDSFAEEEGDVSRLLAATDEQLQEPEGRSRRNAIAHLRAAVAATRADRSKGMGSDEGHDPRGAYRDDLAAAVRPRRATAAEPETELKRVAPLKLVAEQRVDLPTREEPAAAAVAQTVRPRRVSMPVEQEADDSAGGFADFAEEVGAHRLPELLEAAAAYMSFVEGRDEFSRPQLMTKVRQVEASDTSREDRLRSFGQLLRDGKIEKVQGGRFAVSDSIGYRPKDRAVG